ncbi:MAG: apolipoprotein N-acyltransferase [Actinomycetota bacterium]
MHPRRQPANLPLALLAAAVAGASLALAFPDIGWWPLAFLAPGLMMWALIGRRLLSSLLVGLVGGFAFFGLLIFWLTVYLGPVPWLALAVMESLFFALGCAAMALAWRVVPRIWPGFFGRMIALPAVLAGLWTLREAVFSVWPYGGFSWGRLAFSQSDSPFAPLVAWVGVSGLSFLMAFLSAVILQAIREKSFGWAPRGVAAAAVATMLLAFPPWPTQTHGSIRVAAAQGNSNSGLLAHINPGDALNEHLEASIPIIGQDVDVLVWPENAADIDPQDNPYAAQALDYITAATKAPLVAGTITTDSKGREFNSVLLWENGKGTVDQYDKIHPVPFAEYVPDRAFWYPLAPSLIDMVPRGYSIGQRNNVFTIKNTVAGIAICFDIVDDALISKMIDSGAQYILAPTNNADFGHSDESQQQVAIAKLRGIETSRSVVNDSTVGVSAMFAPDGTKLTGLAPFTRGAMIATIPLSTTITPAMVIGRQLEWLAGGFGIAGLALGLLLRRRRGSSSSRSHERVTRR